jgi:hypothetical protein
MSDPNFAAPVESAPAVATPTAPAPVATPPASPVAATPATSQAPATGAAPTVEPSWLKQRLDETRRSALTQASQAWGQQEANYKAQLDAVQKQLHALVGVTPPQNPEVDAIRKQFGQIYPGLSKMEERAAQLEQLLERAGDFESQTEHYWSTYGRQTVDRLFTKAAEAIGAPLTDEGKRLLHSSFVGFVQSSPENTQRYSSDPTIVEEFLKVFSSGIIDPARRQASAAIVGRAPGALPQDSHSGIPVVAGAPKPQNLDERSAIAWAAFNAAKNQ